MALKIYTVLFWVMTLCSLVGGYHCCKNVLSSLSTLNWGQYVPAEYLFLPTNLCDVKTQTTTV